MYEIIQYYKKTKKKVLKILIFLISFLYVFNFMQVDVMQFIESFAISISILFYVLSIKHIIIKQNKKLGFIYALLGILFYNGTITVYIVTAFLICLLENKKINKEFFKKILPAAGIIISVTLINILIVFLVPFFTELNITNRVNGILTKTRLITRLKRITEIYTNNLGFFYNYLWFVINFILIIIVFIYGIKYKKIDKSIELFILFNVYALSNIIMILFGFMGRTTLPIGECISALFIYILCNTNIYEKTKIYRALITTILILYFIVNIINTFDKTNEFRYSNELDKNFVKRIETEIEKIENKGIEVKKYAIYYTLNGNRLRERKYSDIVIKNSCYLLDRNFKQLLATYMDESERLQKVVADKKIVDENFENPSDEEIQIKYIDDVLYVVVDL